MVNQLIVDNPTTYPTTYPTTQNKKLKSEYQIFGKSSSLLLMPKLKFSAKKYFTERVKLHLKRHRKTLEYIGLIFERLSTYPPTHPPTRKLADTGRSYI